MLAVPLAGELPVRNEEPCPPKLCRKRSCRSARTPGAVLWRACTVSGVRSIECVRDAFGSHWHDSLKVCDRLRVRPWQSRAVQSLRTSSDIMIRWHGGTTLTRKWTLFSAVRGTHVRALFLINVRTALAAESRTVAFAPTAARSWSQVRPKNLRSCSVSASALGIH